MKKRLLIHNGFTFIELILYVAIISIVLMSLIPFAWNVIGGSFKSSAQQEVFSQARYVAERIKKEIRDANGVTTCNATTITLPNATASKNPTTFTFSSNQITITQGTDIPSAIRLHSIGTQVTAFSCTNYTSVDTKTENLQFSFTIGDIYTGARQEFNVPAMTVQSSAEVRSN